MSSGRTLLFFALCGCLAISLSTADGMPEVILGDTLSKGMDEGSSLLSRMEALGKRAEEAMGANMKNQDASEMLPRKATTSIHKTFRPSPGAEVTVDVEFGNQRFANQQGIFAALQQRMQHMRKKLSRKIHNWHMPGWVHKMRNRMSTRSRFHHTMRMRKLWMRATLGKQCKTELKMCPHFPCPMRVAKCLRRHHASNLSSACSSFLNKMKEFRDGRKAARKAFRRARRRCRRDNEMRRFRRACIHKARKEKMTYIHGLLSKLQASSPQHRPRRLKQMLSEARKLFDFRMKAIKRFKHKMLKQIKGMRTSNILKSSENADSQRESEAKKKDIDGYVNDPEIMAKKHWTPKIAKLKATYFYSHHAAFKKMKDADEKMDKLSSQSDKIGTTHTGSELAEATDSKMDMNESTPDFLSGDIEAPKGERDMGGWVMRVYTAEQQHRLHVDAMGKPLKDTPEKPVNDSSSDSIAKEDIDGYVNDPEIMAKKHWTPKIAKLKATYFYSHHAAFKKMKEDDEKIRQDQNTASWVNWCIAMMCGGFLLLVLVLCIRRKRQAALGNIYDELAVQTSREQV